MINRSWALFVFAVLVQSAPGKLHAEEKFCGTWRFTDPVSTPEINHGGTMEILSSYGKGASISLKWSPESKEEQFHIELDSSMAVGKSIAARIVLIGTDSELGEVPVKGRWTWLNQAAGKSVAWMMNPNNGWYLTLNINRCSQR